QESAAGVRHVPRRAVGASPSARRSELSEGPNQPSFMACYAGAYVTDAQDLTGVAGSLASLVTETGVPSGVSAIASGLVPTGMAAPGVLVATVIGVTVLLFWLVT